MNPEERLNRLERFAARLAVRGRRTRNDLRSNINALIDAQMRNEDLFNERFARLSAAQDRTEEEIKELRAFGKEVFQAIKELSASWDKKLAASHEELAASHKRLHEEVTASQKQTDEKLRVLIDIVGLDRNGANN